MELDNYIFAFWHVLDLDSKPYRIFWSSQSLWFAMRVKCWCWWLWSPFQDSLVVQLPLKCAILKRCWNWTLGGSFHVTFSCLNKTLAWFVSSKRTKDLNNCITCWDWLLAPHQWAWGLLLLFQLKIFRPCSALHPFLICFFTWESPYLALSCEILPSCGKVECVTGIMLFDSMQTTDAWHWNY